MNMRFLNMASFCLAILGLVTVYLSLPIQENAPMAISKIKQGCSGQVNLRGTVKSLSYSSNGNIIAEIAQNRSTISVLLKGIFFEQGANLSISGRASKFSGKCWIFSDRVEQR